MFRSRGSAARAIAAATAVLAVAACTGSAGGGSGGSGAAATEITVFMPSTSTPYMAQWAQGVQRAVDGSRYTVRLVQSTNGQTEQDQQVQQIIGSGAGSAAYVWWPWNNAAGIASMAALSRTGTPVVAANQLPTADAAPYYAYYSGVSDVAVGRVGGTNVLAARDRMTRAGRTLSSPGGNLVAIDFGAGYGASDDRVRGLTEALAGSGVTVIDRQSGGFDQTAGYQAMSSAIPKNRAAGIDLVFAVGDGVAQGAIQALQEAGYTPGEDVMVVGGNCAGVPTALQNGTQFASAVQGAVMEGQHTGLTLLRYLAGDRTVQPGEQTADAAPDAPPADPGPVFRDNFIPTPAIGKDQIGSFRMWGYDYTQLCVY